MSQTIAPALCATVAAASIGDLRRQRDEASAIADLVELRMDALVTPDVSAALAGRRGPVLITCRPRWEGGGFDGPEETRLALLRAAIDQGAEYIDVEWRSRHAGLLSQTGGRGVVLSMHEFDSVPADLDERYRAMRASGAEVVKLAVQASALADCLPLLALGRRAAAAGERATLVAMGTAGVATRLLPAMFGSCWSYAGDGVAPGQLPVRRMLDEFRFRDVSGSTRLFGVVGRPIGHSLSPAMHNAAFRMARVDGVYLPLEARDAADFLALADALGIEGASVTAPFKVALLESGVEEDDTVREAGALNTLRRSGGGRWQARNTDMAGFLAPLAGVALQGARAAVLGTGGAARAVVRALRSRGAAVVVYGRNHERAVAVAGRRDARAGSPVPGSWDLLVNATPVGTFPEVEKSPLDPRELSAGGIVYDLVYNPARTCLLRDAEAAGCRTIGGLEMLVAQAALQFEWWTGLDAPVGVMREAARERLAETAGVE